MKQQNPKLSEDLGPWLLLITNHSLKGLKLLEFVPHLRKKINLGAGLRRFGGISSQTST
jgi:hypothetical protein